ncbi:MAG: hypothetical protein LBG87_02585 [Spirochaetaceae bacterium]|jgi:hypothetical protein|nr:hypothetical protein [Spirochaetaceae bacterium]
MKKYGILLWTAFLPGFFCSACSNAVEAAESVRQIFGVTAEAPVFLRCKAVSPREITFAFSLPVKVLSLRFEPPVPVESVTDGALVQVKVNEELGAGERISTDILVQDTHQNTLNVLVPFRAWNDRLPAFVITEIRTEYAKPKVEFVEIKTLSPGNLGALRLFIASNGLENPVFEFPPVEVKAGEYIVIHLRSIEEGLVNETGSNLNASKGTEAFPDARDFWIPDAKKLLRKTDAVFFMDQNDKTLDAVVLSEDPDSWGAKQDVAKAAEFLSAQGAWQSASRNALAPRDAVPSKNATATRSICRDERASDNNRASNWYITASSGATPGKPNTQKRYTPKSAK